MNRTRSLLIWGAFGIMVFGGGLWGCKKKAKEPVAKRRPTPRPKPRMTPAQKRLKQAFKQVQNAKNTNGFTIAQTLKHWRMRTLALAKNNKAKPPSPYEWSGVCPTLKKCRVKIAFSDGSFKNRVNVLWDVEGKTVKPANPVAMMLMNPKLAQPRKPAPAQVEPKPKKRTRRRRRRRRRRRYRRRRNR